MGTQATTNLVDHQPPVTTFGKKTPELPVPNSNSDRYTGGFIQPSSFLSSEIPPPTGNEFGRLQSLVGFGNLWIGDYESIPADIRVPHYRTLRTISSHYSKPVGMVRTCHVFWGPTGTGKSRKAWEDAGLDAYPKDPRTKWWDGYIGQQHVVIDEFRGCIDISHLLRWIDRYPFLVEIKGSTIPLICDEIWITSNLHPEKWYPDIDADTYGALLRRLNITHFDSL